MNVRTSKQETTEPPRVTELLSKSTGRGEVLYPESKLFTMFTEAKCKTKTDMIMHLHGLGHPANSIAKTLLEVGILSSKSSYPHVRNTIDRKTAKSS